MATSAGTARVQLCGALTIEVGGRRVESELQGPRVRSLFAYLTRCHGRPVSRAELVDALWDDARPSTPENALSTALARLRRAVAPIEVSGRQHLTLDLGPDAEVDVEVAARRAQEAERALASSDHERALEHADAGWAILSKPLLPDLEGQWLERWRDELATVEARLLETLAHSALALGGGRMPAAERAARALVDRHPFRESGHALLMQVLATLGNVAEASRTFHRLRELLAEELGTAPSPSITELHDRLLREGPAGAGAAGDVSSVVHAARAPAAGRPLPQIGAPETVGRFVGRDEQLSRLDGLWREAAEGNRRLAAVVGEPGVGKTRLACEFASRVHDEGGIVLYGRCEEESILPYQPFVEALRFFLAHGGEPGEGEELAAAAGALGWLVPELRPARGEHGEGWAGDSPLERFRTFEGFNAVLEAASANAPILLVLDDLHWADRSALLLLRHLVRHPRRTQLMVLGTFRDTDVPRDHPLRELLADLRREQPLVRLKLGGLSETATAALVADHLAVPATPRFLHALHERTSGNPLFISETLRSLVESRVLEREEEADEQALSGLGVPEGVAEVINRRLGRLGPQVVDALSTAAVIGRKFDLSVLARVLGTDPDRTLECVEHAMQASLVYEDPEEVDRFTFSHALVQAALHDEISVSRRARLEKRVQAALEELDAPVQSSS